jgi:hypothetical protein
VQQGSHCDAIAAGTDVLSVFEGGVTSIRALNELRPVHTLAKRSTSEEFCVRFDAVERVLTAV